MVRIRDAKAAVRWGFAQLRPTADVFYSPGREMRGVDRFVTVAKPEVVGDTARVQT